MRRTVCGLGIAVLFIGLCSGCGNEEKESIRAESRISPREVDKRVVEASNRFGLALFGDMSRKSPDRNVFLSPISVSAALALMANGASGTTESELKSTLGIEKLTNAEVGSDYRVLLDRLTYPSDEKVRKNFASSLWMRSGMPFDKEFVRGSQVDYAADTFAFGDDDEVTIKKMNDWVEKHTGGKIKEVMKEINGNAVLYVLNTIDFEGAWMEPFTPASTNRARFHVTGKADEDVFVQMMSKGGMYEYAKKSDFEGVRIPIGKQGSAYLAVLLPDESVGALSRLQAKLAAEPTLLTEPYEWRHGTLDLPRVSFNYSESLKESLMTLGMKDAFDPDKANFNRIVRNPDNLFIGKIEHFSSLVIDEQGVQAAAATKIEMLTGSAEPHDSFHITIDRPFVVAIVDTETKAVLFIGTVISPNMSSNK
ncbi:serpin family protein [Cohnella endophytica]|uniref:Serpin family protein n=1 Tax=Cohnella endophytica TaxID=2419778 RepID=A0A494YAM3_9BACL|nr:serpin family protein [Cohnella endophytica]RKP56972.1 serpin family protein [Cohnella endophytica]